MNTRVCVLTTVHQPFDSRIFHKEARSLARAGYKVTIMAPHIRDEVVEDIRIIALSRPTNRLSRMVGLTFQTFWQALKQKADVYHFHDPELIPIGWLLKLFTKAKVIYDVHEDYPSHMLSKTWLPPWLRRIAHYAVIAAEKISVKWLDAIVTPTNGLSERFLHWGGERVVTLHNFPTLEDWHLEEECDTEREYDAIHLGTLSPPRLQFFFDVAQLLNKKGLSLRWCLVGVSEHLRSWAESTLEENYPALSSLFTFVPKVPYEQLRYYLCRSKVGVNHHLPEPRFVVAIPTKVFDYMVQGLPVVSSDMPLLRRIVGNTKAINFVTPGNVEEFAKALEYLIENPDIAGQMGKEGKNLILSRYNWDMESKKLLALYKDLLE